MKLLIILAVLTLARGTVLEQSDEILKELESLVDGKVAKENDDSELEKIIKAIEASDDPEPLSDEEFEKQMLELEENDPTRSRGREPKPTKKPTYRNGDANCHDKYGKCHRFQSNCKLGRYAKLLTKMCKYTCEFCFPEKCEVSKYGCCQDNKERADGRGRKGCPRKLCYDVDTESCQESAKKGRCEEKRVRMQIQERCPLSCKICEPKQKAPKQCPNARGWGCCELDTSLSAFGPKRGCDDTPIYGKAKVPKPTCRDIGYGCCRSDGSKTARGPKQGCAPCKNLSRKFCRRMAKTREDCFSGPTTASTLKTFCPRWCGHCKRT